MNRVRQVRTRKQQARKRAEVLEFPVTVVRNRTYIPRAAFLRYVDGIEADDGG